LEEEEEEAEEERRLAERSAMTNPEKAKTNKGTTTSNTRQQKGPKETQVPKTKAKPQTARQNLQNISQTNSP
jgi:hypothetical protein